MILQMHPECVIVCSYQWFFIKFNTIGTFRIGKSYSPLYTLLLFSAFLLDVDSSRESADVGLAEVVSVVVAISKCNFLQYLLICPDEGFNA